PSVRLRLPDDCQSRSRGEAPQLRRSTIDRDVADNRSGARGVQPLCWRPVSDDAHTFDRTDLVSAALRGALIATRPAAAWAPGSRRARAVSIAVVVVACLCTYWPTVHNGFLQVAFDDAIVVDTAEIRSLDLNNLAALATHFNHAHYV